MYFYQENLNVSSEKSKVISAAKYACLSVGCQIKREDETTLTARERINRLWVDPLKLVINFKQTDDGCQLSVIASSWWWGSKHHKINTIQEFPNVLELKLSGATSNSSRDKGSVRTISKFKDPSLLNLDQRILDLKNKLDDQDSIDFQIQFQKKKKSVLTGVLLAVFLGAYDGHKFYLGQIKICSLYFAFFWTLIPYLIALFEAFNMGKTISNCNYKIALNISENLKK